MSAPKGSPAFRRWSARIDTGTFTHSQCRAFAKLPARMAGGFDVRGDGSVGNRHATTLTEDEASRLVARINVTSMRLEADHTAAGLRWLERYGASARIWGEFPFPVDRLPSFSHFTYAGEHADAGWYRSVPVWRVHFTDDGPWLTYCANSARTDALMGTDTHGPSARWFEGAW